MTELHAELIVDLLVPRELQLAPDGSSVVYTRVPLSRRDDQSSSALWLAALDGSSPPRQFSAGSASDRRPQWAPDAQSIAFLSDRARRGTSSLYLIDRQGGEARPLLKTDLKRGVLDFAWAPDGRRIAFLSADEPGEDEERREKERDDAQVFGERWRFARLRVLKLDGAEVLTLRAERHVAMLAWAPDGSRIAYLSWENPLLESMWREIWLEIAPVDGGDTQRVCSVAGAVWSLHWSADGEWLLFEGSADFSPQSSSVLWAVPASGGSPRQVAPAADSCVAGVQPVAGATELAILIAHGLESRLALFDPASATLRRLYAAGNRDISSWSVCRTPEGWSLAAVCSSATEPWEIWAGTAATEDTLELRQISAQQTALREVRLARQEAFTWVARDGLALDGLILHPPEATDQPLPAMLLVHGGPYSRWGQGLNLGPTNWAQWLATAGYRVLLPNPRGGFGHGTAFAVAARGAVGLEDYHDVIGMLDAAIERGLVDPARVAIGGWSQGGFMAAWAITQSQRFCAAIMGAGVSDWGMMVLTSDLPDFERVLGGGAPWDGLEQRRHLELSPISFATRVRTPVLILHGQNDARVPVSQAIGFQRALRAAGATCELVIYPREGHAIGERTHQLDLLRRVRAWLARWIPV